MYMRAAHEPLGTAPWANVNTSPIVGGLAANLQFNAPFHDSPGDDVMVPSLKPIFVSLRGRVQPGLFCMLLLELAADNLFKGR